MSNSTPYILPSGRVVAIHNDVARGRDFVTYHQLADGSTVTASRTLEGRIAVLLGESC